MSWARDLKNGAYRRYYYLAMYSGLRAFLNRVRSRARHLDPRLHELHGSQVRSRTLGEVALSLHSRARPRAATSGGRHGVISLRQVNPDVGRWVDRFFRATSHFGCGHVEVAFCADGERVTFYGIRNIASANASRLGLSGLSDRFRLSKSAESRLVLRLVSELLQAKGYVIRHATALDCIELTVDERLLPSGSDARMRKTLLHKYEKLSAVINREVAAPVVVDSPAPTSRRRLQKGKAAVQAMAH